MDYGRLAPKPKKNGAKEDINYLRSTLRGHETLYENEEMLDFAEKADKVMEDHEKVSSKFNNFYS